MSSNSKPNENPQEGNFGSLNSCLVEGDPDQITRDRRLRRRSLLLSVIFQTAILIAIVLVPLMSKTAPLPVGIVMPMPPYHRPASPARPALRPHQPTPTRGFSFCLTCPSVLPSRTTNTNNSIQNVDDSIGIDITGDPSPDCSGCIPLDNANPQPAAVLRPSTPHIVHVTHIDPALLIHRVEPTYPTLGLHMRREGTVELHAIIATDGSVRSLQVLEGDAFFYLSALDAVRQWRYKPTILNGLPVEVDTHITAIYRLNH